MGKRRHTAEQIIGKLREAEVLTGKGMPMDEVLRQLGISDATYYKWSKEYGGLRIDQARRLKVPQKQPKRYPFSPWNALPWPHASAEVTA